MSPSKGFYSNGFITTSGRRSSMEIQHRVTEHSRPAIELYFDVCTMCRAIDRKNCTCHDDGKGQN